jgi:MinD-like ATPase involved in chromosome partitioning or flagellar assembly
MRQRIDCLLVASGKGGVGTSVIASLAALSAAERRDRVLLVDANEGGGTLHHLFGVRPTSSLWMLADERTQPNDVVMRVDENVTLVAGGTSATAIAPTTETERRSALARLAHVYGDYDTIIFDGGSRLDTISAIAELTDPTMLLVTSADRLALAANYALVKSVSGRRSDAPIAVVANRHNEALAAEACEFLVGACAHFLGRTIDVAGVIPDDPCLQAAVGAGMAVRDALDGSPAAEAMRGIVTTVLPSTRTFGVPGSSAGLPPSPSPSPSSPSFRRWS